jgi:hypothetical protein
MRKNRHKFQQSTLFFGLQSIEMRVLLSCVYSVLNACVLLEAGDLLLHAVELENLELLRSIVCLELLEGALAASHIGLVFFIVPFLSKCTEH